MKKIILYLLLLIEQLCCINTYAYDALIKGIYYDLNSSKKTAVVTCKSAANYYEENRTAYKDTVIIPKSVTYNGITYLVTDIGRSAFYECSNLKSVIIPNSVTTIQDYAFYSCSGLTSVLIPNSVTSISSDAFWKCSSITSITIPSSITYIGSDAFRDCNSIIKVLNLSKLSISKGSKNNGYVAYSAKVVYNIEESAIVDSLCFYTDVEGNSFVCGYLGNSSQIVLPQKYNGKNYNIAQYAFYKCTGLTSLVIPNTVRSVGDYSFYACSCLMSVSIPNSVTDIGRSAFLGCSRLTSVTIPNSVTNIGNSAFSGCSGLTSVTIPSSITSIDNAVFSDCRGLTSVTIPSSVTNIGGAAFSGCSGLTSITIPNSVISIDASAFSGCSRLASVTIPNSVTSIGASAFYGCNNLVDLKYNAKNVTTSSYNSPFPTSIKTITIGNEVEVIPSYFLYGNKNITSVTIPNSVISIDASAFSGCSRLASVTIPNSVTSIGSYVFGNCSGLTSVTIPSSITNIDVSTFLGCSGLTSITIPNSVTSIGNSAFSGCSGLTSVTIPSSITSIGNAVFSDCRGLTSVTIPSSVTSIGASAFSGCSGLTSITIPNSVTNIVGGAFENCYGIKEIYSLNAAPPKADCAFSGMNTQHAKVFVPEGAADAYKYAHGWMDFLNIFETTYSIVLPAAEPITISDNVVEIAKGYYIEKTVTYVREGAAISKENYASFCLPFAVDPADAQFKAVYVPVGLSLYDTEANTLRIGFYQTDDIIPAGTPFLAQLAVDGKVEIKNALPVNYAPNAPAVKTSVVRTFNHSNSAGIMNENNDYAISFSGSYNKVSPANGYTFNTDGSIGASANVVPFRAYFVIGKNASNAKILTSFDIDAETTGIGQLRMTNDDMPIYDINGRRVNEKSLKSGIYIKNGKKYVK